MAASDPNDAVADPAPAASTAKDNFGGKNIGSAAVPCAKCQKWTIESIEAQLMKCPIGKQLMQDAIDANDGEKPTYVFAKDLTTSNGTHVRGYTHFDPTEIHLKTNQSRCGALQTLMMELHNAGHGRQTIDSLAEEVGAGDRDSFEFATGVAKMEHEGMQKSATAFRECKEALGCPDDYLGEGFGSPDFQQYILYQQQKNPGYLKEYENRINDPLKKVYDDKHPNREGDFPPDGDDGSTA